MSASSSVTGKKAPITATQAGATNPSGNLEPLLVDVDGNLLVAGTFTGSSPSVGPTGSPVPADADYIGAMNPGGNLVGLKTNAAGDLLVEINTDTDGLATASNQTSGAQKTQVVNSSDVSVDAKTLGTQVVSTDVGLVVNSVIHGLTTAGGGSYVDVKVNPSGSLAVDASGSTGLVLAAGTAIVGKVGIDQTTPGTTNGVQINAALPAGGNTIGNVGIAAGSAIIGNVSIDQTTPGTTNGVQVNAALPAGSAIIGKFGIDQTTPGTTNGVQVNAALPAGTNLIGKTGIDQTTPGTTNAVAVAQIGANTVLTGNGVTGTGSQRVTIASDNTAFTVNNQVIGQSGSTNANSSLASTALEASHVIKAGSGRLFQLTGVNTKSSAQYIQVFNSTTVPADTTAPVLLAYVPAGGVFSWDFGSIGRYFSTGIAVSNSSTAATKTIGSADCWFNAEYL